MSENFGRYSLISGIVLALLLPGGIVLVPVIAWWRQRKRAAKRALRQYAAPGLPRSR